MSILEAVFLGLLQGLTEFLPVSSSAHLVAAQAALGVEAPGATLEVALHFGTLLAIVAVLWAELLRVAVDGVRGAALWVTGAGREVVAERAPLFPTAVAVAVGTVPAGLAGVLLGSQVERAFESLTVAGALLMVTGLVLVASRFAGAPKADGVGPRRGFAVGVAQALALLPGISRSGATITAGYFAGVDRRAAARFSFLLAVPALAGAALLKLREAPAWGADGGSAALRPAALAVGAGVSAVVGAACLVLLLRTVERGRLHWFAAYCLPAGAAMAVAGALS